MSARTGIRWGRAAVGAVVAVVAVSSAAAQQPRAPRAPRAADAARECRCVDADGNALERCTCFVLPEVDVAPLLAMAGRRVVLGVNVRQDQDEAYDAQGVRLYGVEPDSPAGEAGLEEGDVLVRVGDQSLLARLADADAEDDLDPDRSLPVQRLLAVLAEHEAGDRVEVEYLRGGERRTATVELEGMRGFMRFAPQAKMSFGPGGAFGRVPEVPMVHELLSFGGAGECPRNGSEATEAGERRKVVVHDFGRSCVAGVELLEMNAGLAEYFGAADGGVLVSDASADNTLGLRAGDVLLSVDGRAVRGVEQALRVLQSYDDDEAIDLQVRRKDQTVAVQGRLR